MTELMQLVVIEGPDKGKKWLLDPKLSYGLGRASENRIVLHDPTVSKRHARLQCVDGIWFIEDLGSRHGTIVNDAPLSERHALFPDDTLRLGKTHLRLCSSGST